MRAPLRWQRVIGISFAIISSLSLVAWVRFASMRPESHQASVARSADADGVNEPILPSKATCPAANRTKHANLDWLEYAPDLYSQGYGSYVVSPHLAAMNEPLLWCGDLRESYRFTWLRTFHHPIAVRVTQSEAGMTLVAIELDGAGGYEPGKEFRRVTRALNAAEETQVRHAIKRAGIWSPSRRPETYGLDGATWLLEGRHASRYHAIARWAPQAGEVREAGLMLLKLSGLNIDPGEVY